MVPLERKPGTYRVKALSQMTPQEHRKAELHVFRRLGDTITYTDLMALFDPNGRVLSALAFEPEHKFIRGIAQTPTLREIQKASKKLRPLNEEMPRSPAEELMLHFLHREAQKGRMPYLGSFTSDGKALVKRMGKKYNRHGLSIGENPNYEPHRTLQFNPVDAHPIALVAKADWRSE